LELKTTKLDLKKRAICFVNLNLKIQELQGGPLILAAFGNLKSTLITSHMLWFKGERCKSSDDLPNQEKNQC